LSKYWFDSFPGVEVETEHPILDFYKTPYGGPEHYQHNDKHKIALDVFESWHAPYTTVSQNRGGIA
jgi:hypothetical protein